MRRSQSGEKPENAVLALGKTRAEPLMGKELAFPVAPLITEVCREQQVRVADRVTFLSLRSTPAYRGTSLVSGLTSHLY